MTILPDEKHPDGRVLDVRVVVHTHWDREWYQPEPRFRQRLVALVDELLDRQDRLPFLLDGQAALLEDYLAVRPERASDLSTALRRGDIEAGPWFVLADELIPSGEGLVRNLLAGRHVLETLRAAPPRVLYCPDAFGHPAALPAMAAGFGCATIVVWRGFGGAAHPAGDAARWSAPDGSLALLVHLPPDGYEFGSNLPSDGAGAVERWTRVRQVLAPRATTGVVLLTSGADHHAPPASIDAAIDALASAAAPDRVTRSSLAAFAEALREAAATRELPTVQGELRDSYGFAWTLQSTFGARAALKRAYAMAERDLVRDVEPWLALAWLRHGADRRHVLRQAWRPVLLCQPHDTLCGTAVDAVALAMRQRLDEAGHAAAELRHGAIDALLGHDADAARAARDDWRPVIVVRNQLARRRAGVAELDVDIVLAESPVGPGSAGAPVTVRRAPAVSLGESAATTQIVARRRMFVREESPRGYPCNRLVERRHMLAWVDDAPAYGLLTLPIRGARRSRTEPTATVSSDARSISGSGIHIHIAGDGLRFEHGGHRLEDWIGFEAEGERGDLYTSSTIPGTLARAELARARVTVRGPLRAEIEAHWRLVIPARRLTRAAGGSRQVPQATVRLRTRVRLQAGEPFARILVDGRNTATDARIRFVVRTGQRDCVVHADAALGALRREPIAAPHSVPHEEHAPPTMPLHRYVTMTTPGGGATLVSDGLAEAEARDDGALAVTLLRAVGELSRHDLPERPGHAGYPVETPLAQEQGPFEASFGFALHGPRSVETVALVERLADEVLLPLRGHTWRTAIAPPALVPGVGLSGEGLAFGAVKPAEDGLGIVLRCVNLVDEDVEGAWSVPGATTAHLARLDERPLGALGVEAGVIRFRASPHAAVTIRVG